MSSEQSTAPYTLGLTGGIASGKSTVRELLGRIGAATIDADKLGHRCYEPGTDCFKEVVALFGDSVVAEDGQINRRALGSIVFSSEDKMKQLSATTWPHIKRMIREQIDEHRKGSAAVVVVEAAVLVEAGWGDVFDETWVAYVKPEVALKRLMARNSLSEEEAAKRMASQISNEERLAKAKVSIENSGTQQDLEQSVRAEWAELCKRLQTAGKRLPTKLKKPRFGKVAAIKPDSKGLNLLMKVMKKEEDATAKVKAWNVVAGDASGVVTVRLVNQEQARLCESGASIKVQNARVTMIKGHVHIIVDKWAVLKTADSALEVDVKTDKDISATEYELAGS